MTKSITYQPDRRVKFVSKHCVIELLEYFLRNQHKKIIRNTLQEKKKVIAGFCYLYSFHFVFVLCILLRLQDCSFNLTRNFTEFFKELYLHASRIYCTKARIYLASFSVWTKMCH